MIELVIDCDSLYVKPGTTVTGISDYVPAYSALHDAVHKKSNLVLIARHRTCAQWLRRSAAKYGRAKVRVTEYNVRKAVEEAWGVAVPAAYSDFDLSQDRLYEYAVNAKPGQAFEDALLQAFYAPEFSSHRVPIGNLPGMFAAHDQERWNENSKLRCVVSTYKRRLQEWIEASRTEAESSFVQLMADDFSNAKLVFEQYVVLAAYPADVGRRAIGEWFGLLSGMGIKPGEMPISSEAAETLNPHVTVYLDRTVQSIQDIQGVAGLLATVSGLLKAEFRAIVDALKLLPGQVSQSMITDVRKKFAPIRSSLGRDLSRLDIMTSPPVPSLPSDLESAESWVSWAVTEYLPYRFWCEQTGHQDDTLDDYSEQFQNWLYSGYVDLQANYPSMLHNALLTIRDWAERDTHLVILVVDNLGLRFWPTLQRAFNERGFSVSRLQHALANVPTETEIGKKCLLGSTSQHAEVAALDYPALAARWEGHFGQRKVRYVPDPTTLVSIQADEPGVFIVNYLPLDSTLHQDVKSLGQSHSVMAEFQLDGLASTIRDWVDASDIQNKVQIAVVADHGAAKFDKGAVNLVDSAFLRSRVEDAHHRFLRLTDEELSKFPANLGKQCFVLKKETYGLANHYVIASRYYRFRETSDGSFVHGGLSPEESIVPVALLEPVTTEVDLPVLTLVSRVFRYGNPETIEVELTNPSRVRLEDVTCTFTAEGLQAGGAYVASVDPKSVVKLSVEGRFRKTDQPQSGMTVECTFWMAGKEHRLAPLKEQITVRSLVERQERRFR